jgi:hypothetical protein
VSVSQLAVQLLLQSLWMQISTFVISCLIAWPCGQAKKAEGEMMGNGDPRIHIPYGPMDTLW